LKYEGKQRLPRLRLTDLRQNPSPKQKTGRQNSNTTGPQDRRIFNLICITQPQRNLFIAYIRMQLREFLCYRYVRRVNFSVRYLQGATPTLYYVGSYPSHNKIHCNHSKTSMIQQYFLFFECLLLFWKSPARILVA
jgi:hypothetical protein